VCVPSTRPIKEFLENEWPSNQSIEEWVQKLSTLTYQEKEWRAPWIIRSTVLIGCGGHLWDPLIGIWEVRRVSDEKIVEIEVLEGDIFSLNKESKIKEGKNKEVIEEYMELQAEDICEQIEELKKESTPFVTRNEPTMKLLKVAQAHYQAKVGEGSEMDKGKLIVDEEAHKFSLIEECLKAIEGLDTFGSIEVESLCMVLDVVVPPKFKVPDFEEFNGSNCPITHITMYCRKMVAYSKYEKLLIHIFQDSLTGYAARWYVKLDKSQI
ncbi:hypothetical protein Goklo_006634, partial [Gossypium klotzschianum]|nr:hypothetical protein [Gossypium klotzschianum]